MNPRRGPAGLIIATLGWFTLLIGGVFWPLPGRVPRPPPMPLEAPVPLLETTPAAVDGGVIARMVLVGLPPPASNQVQEGSKCEAPAKMRRGGCWVAVADELPPCDPPAGKQRRLWPEDGKCWLPVGTARTTPTSGGGAPVGVADP